MVFGAAVPANGEGACGERAGHRVVLDLPKVVVWEEVTDNGESDPLARLTTTITRGCVRANGAVHELRTVTSSAKDYGYLYGFRGAGTHVAYVSVDSYFGDAYSDVATIDLANGRRWVRSQQGHQVHAVDVSRLGAVAWARDGRLRGRKVIRLFIKDQDEPQSCVVTRRKVSRLELTRRYLTWRSDGRLRRRSLSDC